MKTPPIFLIVSIASCVLSEQTATPFSPTCPTMELSVVADKPDGSTRSITSEQGKAISLTETPLLTIVDFKDANVSLTEGQIVLNVSMTTEGAKRVQAFTANNVGKMIAFLVNGRVTNVLKILDPITGNGFLIGPFLRDEAQKLAESINHREIGCQPFEQDGSN